MVGFGVHCGKKGVIREDSSDNQLPWRTLAHFTRIRSYRFPHCVYVLLIIILIVLKLDTNKHKHTEEHVKRALTTLKPDLKRTKSSSVFILQLPIPTTLTSMVGITPYRPPWVRARAPKQHQGWRGAWE